MIWNCANCDTRILGELVKPNIELMNYGRKPRFEPISHYWKGNDIEEAYCSAGCSLTKYQSEIDMIFEQIIEAKECFRMKHNSIAESVYLGREEMHGLTIWAEINKYIDKDGTVYSEGKGRIEINGLRAYQVNTENHLAIA